MFTSMKANANATVAAIVLLENREAIKKIKTGTNEKTILLSSLTEYTSIPNILSAKVFQ